MNLSPAPPPSKPPSPPRRKLTSLPALNDGEEELVPSVVDDDREFSTNIVFDDDTGDLSELSQAQLYDLNQLLFNESVPTRPLIDDLVPIEVLRAEYENGSPYFVQQIDWLKGQGFSSIRRTKGDGDCFYRSIAFAFVERVLESPDQDLAAARALSVLMGALPMLEQVGFQSLVFEDFYEALVSIIQNIVTPDNNGNLMTLSRLLEEFQTPEVSNSIVVFLRMLTSAQIRRAPEDFEAVLFDPETGEHMDARLFCEYFVEASGKEAGKLIYNASSELLAYKQVSPFTADHVQMTALCRALQLNIDVAYLDGRRRDSVDFVPIRSADPSSKPLILLYRPGHYDILVKPR